MSWHADYNVVAPVSGNLLDIVGWVTLDNQTGKTFSNAHIKLMAGDVTTKNHRRTDAIVNGALRGAAAPAVTERNFDEYHLYTLGASCNWVSTAKLPTVVRPRQWRYPPGRSMSMTASSWTRTIAAVGWNKFVTWKTLASSRTAKIWSMVELEEQQGKPSWHAAAQGPRAFIVATPTAKLR